MSLIEQFFMEFGEAQKPMAASVQSLQFCTNLIRKENVQHILDSGSGLSSVIFHSEFDDVCTIDDDPYWAEKTSRFIAANINKEVDIGPIGPVGHRTFPFIFYDYGGIETRIYYFKKVLEMCDRYLFIDDMHINYYREYVQAKTKGYVLKFVPETVDEYGRYGALLIKDKQSDNAY